MLGHVVKAKAMSATRLGLPVLIIGMAGTASRADDTAAPEDIRNAVASSSAYLTKEGVAWMKQQQCASCHHIPMMIWGLNEARTGGYKVDEKSLDEVTRWSIVEKNHDQVFPDLPLDKKRTETDYLGPLFMALALGADPDRDEPTEGARLRLLSRALSQQAKDGSWHANSGGRPPVHASKDVQTTWVLLALADRPMTAPESTDPWNRQREAAAEWLCRNPPANTHQALAMRLLLCERLAKPKEGAKPALESLLRSQNTDGGWSQTAEMKSDAFATGLALCVLAGREDAGAHAAVKRGQFFLVKNQQRDGSWPMASRRAEPSGPGPARDLRPIRYFATAWATIGLARSGAQGVKIKK
jgi:squalene-hopene/tetraprenyl-beta-curcumene cyclase